MQLYIIELEQRIKVGRSKNSEKRFNSILTAAGIKKSEVLNFFSFNDKAKFEQKILHTLDKQKINGEWFYKKGIVINFLNEIKQQNEIDDDLIVKIQVDKKYDSIKNKAISIFRKIREERKGFGFPLSPSINTIIKSKKVSYKNMTYHISEDFSTYTREVKFDIFFMTNSQIKECLIILKNHEKAIEKKEKIQLLIDKAFNNDHTVYESIVKMVGEFFGIITDPDEALQNTTENKCSFKFDNILDCYYSDYNFEMLSNQEIKIIKNSKRIKVEHDCIVFEYNSKKCFVYFSGIRENILKEVS